MAHGDGMVNAMDEEPIVQRKSTATLIHKMKEDALVTAPNRAVVGLYKELGDQAVRLHALGTQVAGFAKDVGPFVERLRRLGLEQ
jgi:hypothetical protein